MPGRSGPPVPPADPAPRRVHPMMKKRHPARTIPPPFTVGNRLPASIRGWEHHGVDFVHFTGSSSVLHARTKTTPATHPASPMRLIPRPRRLCGATSRVYGFRSLRIKQVSPEAGPFAVLAADDGLRCRWSNPPTRSCTAAPCRRRERVKYDFIEDPSTSAVARSRSTPGPRLSSASSRCA